MRVRGSCGADWRDVVYGPRVCWVDADSQCQLLSPNLSEMLEYVPEDPVTVCGGKLGCGRGIFASWIGVWENEKDHEEIRTRGTALVSSET